MKEIEQRLQSILAEASTHLFINNKDREMYLMQKAYLQGEIEGINFARKVVQRG